MSFADKVIGYIPVGQHREENLSKGKVLIRAAKQEISFRGLHDRNSILSKFCELTATDTLVRLMVFQKCTYEFVPSHSYPLAVYYPVFLNKDDAFLEGDSFSETSPVLKLLLERRNAADTVARESSSSVLLRFMRVLFSDPSLRKSVVSGKPPKKEEAGHLMEDALEKQEKQTYEMYEDLMEFQKAHAEDLDELDLLFSSLKVIPEARNNHLVLTSASPSIRDGRVVADAIAKIEGLRGMRIVYSSVCLECRFRNNLASSIMIELNPRSPRTRTICTKCSGTTILHQMVLCVPQDMIQVFHENHIQELAIAYAVAQSPLIERVYVHKKVSTIVNGDEKPGREVDVLAISKDKRGLAFEVTTTNRQSAIPEKASNKTRVLADLPLDHIFYISGDPTISRPEISSPDTVVMGTQQIARLDKYATEYLSNQTNR